MKEFDLEAAKRGAKVCTRRGEPARILCYDLIGAEYPLVAAVRGGDDKENIDSYTIDGKYDYGKVQSADLMMADDDYLEKLARGEYGPTPASADPAPATDPWDAFKREAAMELLRQRNGFVGRDIVEWVTSDVNRLVEGLKGEKEE